MRNNEIVHKLWNLCDVLRDDGINSSDYVTELVVLLLFIRMEHENSGHALERRSSIAAHSPLPTSANLRSISRRIARRTSASAKRRRSSAVCGDSAGTLVGRPSSSTAIMVKKQLFT
jgi:hypothetical protein